MKNISKYKNCYGCGLCAVVCAKQIIDIKLNKEGFYQPYIKDSTQCTECGLCLDVCSFSKSEIATKPVQFVSYAAWSKNEDIRRKSSSGGVTYELASYLIDELYKVCGCRYNAKEKRAEHYITENKKELEQSLGSKYIQSYTIDALKKINKKDKHLVIGTPCQIDSFRRYIKKFRVEDNFILVDFFCHGVPSNLIWSKYVAEVEKFVGDITTVLWRDKLTGWHDSWSMVVDGEKGQIKSRHTQGDKFYSMFLGNNCLGRACYKDCKYKYLNSSADIRVGDCWGCKYKDNIEGVSAVVAFTKKGSELLQTNKNIELVDLDVDVVAEGQMKKSLNYPTLARPLLLSFLKLRFVPLSFIVFCNRVFNKLRRICHL